MTADVRESFGSLLVVIQHFLASEKFSQSDSYRVSIFATKIADTMDLGSERTEALRSAALLRDLSRLGISNDILYKAANVSRDEIVASFRKGRKVDPRAQNMGGSLRRVIPIIAAQQILLQEGARAINVPMEAHILAVADAYQKLTSGNSGKALSPEQAEEMIVAGSGEKYHTGVVDAFVKAFGERARGVGAGE
jgi:HD-GYP domain-containing protein (c-di-GMP phosphodiesterase class II)